MEAVRAEKIEKEALGAQQFIREDVLSDPGKIQERRHQLERACKLGNEYKGKVRITFGTVEGQKEVYTTIWNVSERFVGLKSGSLIPIHSIYQVAI